MENPILKHRQQICQNILKSFGEDLDIEKARGGIYMDTYHNRKLARVG